MNEDDLPLTAAPRNLDDLNMLVVETIAARWKAPPIEREPNEFAMRFSAITVLMTTSYDPIGIRVSGQLEVDIADLEAAYVNVRALNLTHPHLKFSIQGGSLVVETYLHAMPFVPDHLLVALSMMTDLSREVGAEMVATLVGDAPPRPRRIREDVLIDPA